METSFNVHGTLCTIQATAQCVCDNAHSDSKNHVGSTDDCTMFLTIPMRIQIKRTMRTIQAVALYVFDDFSSHSKNHVDNKSDCTMCVWQLLFKLRNLCIHIKLILLMNTKSLSTTNY